MNSLRWILLILGILLIAGIYWFEKRRAAKPRNLHTKNREPVFAEKDYPENDTVHTESMMDKNVVAGQPVQQEAAARSDNDLEFADLADLIRDAALDPVRDAAQDMPRTTSVTTEKGDERRKTLLLNQNIVAIYLLARDPAGLYGSRLKQVFSTLNIHYSEQKVFHYYENKKKLFSIANLVEPGTFDLTTLNAFRTPGLAVYMLLDEVSKPEQAFAHMLRIIWELSEQLQARICDAERHPMNQQTVAEMLEAVKIYSQGRLLR